MGKICKPVRTVLSVFIFTLLTLLIAQQNKAMALAETSYVVTFAETASPALMESVIASHDLEATRVFDDMGMATVRTDDQAALEALSNNPNVLSVTTDRTVTIPEIQISAANTSIATSVTDPLYLTSQWHIRRVKADLAWADSYTASHDTVVGVIDTGIAYNHPDLAVNVIYNKCFSGFQPTCDPYPQFPSNLSGNHGTAMAGIIGAAINGVGVVGVSPDVGLANYNVAELDPNTGFPTVLNSSIWAAVEDAAEQGFEVLNFSFGEVLTKPLSDEDKEFIKNWERVAKKANKAGVTMIGAAGNDGLDINDKDVISVPCEIKDVICAGATNIRPQPVFPQPGYVDETTFYTNYGKKAVDIAAPGGDCGGPDFNTCLTAPDPRYFVWTTNVSANATCGATHDCPVAYTASIGTSFSAPHTAGVAALVIDAYRDAKHKKLKPKDVEKILTKSAEDIDLPQLGAGMVDAEAAIERALD